VERVLILRLDLPHRDPRSPARVSDVPSPTKWHLFAIDACGGLAAGTPGWGRRCWVSPSVLSMTAAGVAIVQSWNSTVTKLMVWASARIAIEDHPWAMLPRNWSGLLRRGDLILS
jgi:hypothetical protein